MTSETDPRTEMGEAETGTVCQNDCCNRVWRKPFTKRNVPWSTTKVLNSRAKEGPYSISGLVKIPTDIHDEDLEI